MGDYILSWANKYTRGHDNIKPVDNLTDAFADGMAFCALLHTWFPEKIPMKDRTANTREQKIANLALAFKVASEAGIESLLEAEDIVDCQDQKSMLLYFSYVYDVCKLLPVKFQSSPEWNRKWEESEKQRKFAEWKAKQNQDKPPEPEKRETSGGSVASRWNPGGGGATEAKPLESSGPSSPQSSNVGWKYAVTGKGANGGPSGSLLMFTVTIKKDGKALTDSKKEDLVVYIDSPVKVPSTNVMGGTGGAWHVGFTPQSKGKHWVDFVYKGEFIGQAYALPIGGNDDHPYTGKERAAAGF